VNTARALAIAVAVSAASLALLAALPDRPARAQASKMPSGCSVAITESAHSPLPACEAGAVTVTMGVTCPPVLPFHMVFVVARHLLMEDHLSDVKRAARDAANMVEFTGGTQGGVISLSVQERVEQDMTDNRGSVVAAIGRVQLDNVNPTATYYDWLGRAGRMLEEAREDAPAPPLEAVVLYSTGCPTGFESYCNRQAAAANQLKGDGITVIGVCNPNARPFGIPLPGNHCRHIQQIASDGFYYDLGRAAQVGKALVEIQETGRGVKAKKVQLTEMLAGNLALVPGSGLPAPVVEASKLTFAWEDVAPGTTVTATYRVRPGAPGRSALRTADSEAVVVDTLGRVSAPVTVPLRAVEVVPCAVDTPTPTATPTETPRPTDTPTAPPTATRTPADPPTPTPSPIPATPTATPRPTATATPEPGVAYLPLALRFVCKPAERHSDVVLAIDASTSMGESLGPSTKLEAAREAARRFVEVMSLGPAADQAAIVAFNAEATVALPLTGDRAALGRAIDGVATALGTRIDHAIARAAEELASPRARPGNQAVLVLLTDGRPDGGTLEATLAAADAAKGRGVIIFTVGLGDGVDADFMRRLATRPDGYLQAPDGAALRAIYEGLAAALPCTAPSMPAHAPQL